MENKQLIIKLGNCGLCGITTRVYLESDGNLTDYLCKSCIKKIKDNHDKLMKKINKKQNRFLLLKIINNKIQDRIQFDYILEMHFKNDLTTVWEFIDCEENRVNYLLGCHFDSKITNPTYKIIERKGLK